jgi:hypothetical protein
MMSAPGEQYHRAKRSFLLRALGFWAGVLLVIISPVVGAIPGPGGVVVFALGAGLMLRNSRWAKKKYARFKRKHPKKGAWADWSLRRASARRRHERDKALRAAEAGGASADAAATLPLGD